jgi:KipI family sensor histidine kinase inhibitor
VVDPAEAVRFVCREYGDAAVLVDVHAAEYEDRWSAAQGLGTALRDARIAGVVDVVASYHNVFVSFDPLTVSPEAIRDEVDRLGGPRIDPGTAQTFLVPVVYGGEYGPDLDDVAAELSLSAHEVVDVHTSGPWVVRFCASPLGAPMMDGPRMPQSVRRMREPRARVEPGSVALSGFQTTIYPPASPGGWRLIGRTPATLFDLGRDPMVAHRPGDAIRFVPIPESDWADWSGPLRVDDSADPAREQS